MKAIWQDTVIAESDNTIVVEGNHYFPENAVYREYLVNSTHHTSCFWKGEASYFHIEGDGKRNDNAAWYYPTPKSKAENIKGYVAFWKGVDVV